MENGGLRLDFGAASSGFSRKSKSELMQLKPCLGFRLQE